MRRFAVVPRSILAAGAASAVAAAAVVTTPSRAIYPSFSAIACEPWAKKESWLKRVLFRSHYRSHDVLHTPRVEAPGRLQLNSTELFLLSSIEDDTQRLLNISWAYDFDAYWADVIYSHTELFNTLYNGAHPIRRLFLGNCSKKTAEKTYIEAKLNRLTAIHEWAVKTEEVYSSIYNVRYMMQRTVYNQLERERYLCGCVEAVEAIRAKVPEELEQKVMGELDMHLTNLRHWVNGCPVGKTTFTRRLA